MKITIITVCFNAAEGLKETMKSILNQNYREIEWVIVDGKSIDNTEMIITSYSEQLMKKGIEVNFKSEKDNGIYDAMNKGIKRATGEWCIFMNAGDIFYSNDSLEQLVIEDMNNYDIIYGDCNHVYKNKFKFCPAKNENELTFSNGMEFCHQSVIIRKEKLEILKYSTDYRIAGDYDFFVRAFQLGYKFKHIDSIISEFQMDGISSTNGAKVILENNNIKFRYNLIDEHKYMTIKKKCEMNLMLRSFLPKLLINMRHNYIMKKSTKNWNFKNKLGV